MFGFGNNNDDGQQSGGGFFSGIGSFLWKAIKWAAVAVVGVVTLGAVFRYSPTAKNFVDEHTKGKDGRGGWGSAIADFSIIETIKGLFKKPKQKGNFF